MNSRKLLFTILKQFPLLHPIFYNLILDLSHSRAYLLDQSQNHSNQSSRTDRSGHQINKQVRRSASDVTSNTTNLNRNKRNSPHNKVKNRGEMAVVEVHHQTSVEPKQGSSKRSHTNSDKSSRVPYRDSNFILNNASAVPNTSLSRDNKNEIHFDANNLLSRERESQTTTIIEESDEVDIGYRPYTYQGSLSTANISDTPPQKYENEIVARMEKIWEEKQIEEDKVLVSNKHGQYNLSYSHDTEIETRLTQDLASSDTGNQRPSTSSINIEKKIHKPPVSLPAASETPDLATQGKHTEN